jgi:hypothetical protein
MNFEIGYWIFYRVLIGRKKTNDIRGVYGDGGTEVRL